MSCKRTPPPLSNQRNKENTVVQHVQIPNYMYNLMHYVATYHSVKFRKADSCPGV